MNNLTRNYNIGSRWKPGAVIRRDTDTGTFEYVNQVDLSDDALWIQQALLMKPPPRGQFSWYGAAPVISALAMVAVLAYFAINWRLL
jgi:hypothetical protein